MNPGKLFLLALIALCAGSSGFAQNWSPAPVEKAAKEYVNSKKHPGLAISIYFQGETRIISLGETKKGSGESISENSIFEIGQLSEVFTSALMAEMTYGGLMSPERTLSEYLPDDFPVPVFDQTVCAPQERTDAAVDDGADPYRKEPTDYLPSHEVFCYPVYGSPPGQITFCQTASHTSGLPALLKKRKHSCADLGPDDLRDFLMDYQLNESPGMGYQPSEIGPSLMGLTLAHITGKSYEATLTQRVCEPLGLTQTRISAGPGLQTDLVSGHNKSGKPVAHCEPGILGPAIGLRTTGKDMLAFLTANLDGEDENWSRIFMECHQARIDLPEAKTEGGYGWKISYLPGINGQVTWKSGKTPGFASYLALNKDRRYGISLLSNSTDDVRELGQKLMKILDGFVVEEKKDKPAEAK